MEHVELLAKSMSVKRKIRKKTELSHKQFRSVIEEDNWRLCYAFQKTNRIVVENEEEIIYLQDHGCYGDVIEMKYEEEIKKVLFLDICEAFYLSHHYATLLVFPTKSDLVSEKKDSSLSLIELWTIGKDKDPDFQLKYAAYNYYRNKGWIVRPGIKNGVHWLLYSSSPQFVHSQYCCIIIRNQRISKLDFQLFSRLSESVGKKLLLLHISYQNGTTIELVDDIDEMKNVPTRNFNLSKYICGKETITTNEIMISDEKQLEIKMMDSIKKDEIISFKNENVENVRLNEGNNCSPQIDDDKLEVEVDEMCEKCEIEENDEINSFLNSLKFSQHIVSRCKNLSKL
ncbi:hypothetical protein SNEBB_004265 [Seison nebaliae]|nr:hypothetical protein SNEBB_004265 [Seison nebaliae]